MISEIDKKRIENSIIETEHSFIGKVYLTHEVTLPKEKGFQGKTFTKDDLVEVLYDNELIINEFIKTKPFRDF